MSLPTSTSLDRWGTLAIPILDKILSELYAEPLAISACVCRTWRTVASSPKYWLIRSSVHFGNSVETYRHFGQLYKVSNCYVPRSLRHFFSIIKEGKDQYLESWITFFLKNNDTAKLVKELEEVKDPSPLSWMRKSLIQDICETTPVLEILRKFLLETHRTGDSIYVKLLREDYLECFEIFVKNNLILFDEKRQYLDDNDLSESNIDPSVLTQETITKLVKYNATRIANYCLESNLLSVRNIITPNPLCLACELGYQNMAQILLRAGARVASKYGSNPLSIALQNENLTFIPILLEAGAKVDDEVMRVALKSILDDFSAIESLTKLLDRYDEENCLIDEETQTAKLPQTYVTSLGLATRNTPVVFNYLLQRILRRGWDVSPHLDRLWQSAISYDQPEVCKILINKLGYNNFDSNEFKMQENSRAYSIACLKFFILDCKFVIPVADLTQYLHNAILDDHAEDVPFLFEHKADPKLLIDNKNVFHLWIDRIAWKTRYLGYASQLFLTDPLLKLLDIMLFSGVDVNMECEGKSPMNRLLKINTPTTCKIAGTLASTGMIHLQSVDQSGLTPLHIACQQKNIELIQIFIKHGAPVNLCGPVTVHRQTPLHLAVNADSYASVKILIEIGNADINIKDRNNLTPFQLAQYLRHNEIIDYFQQKFQLPLDQDEIKQFQEEQTIIPTLTPNSASRREVTTAEEEEETDEGSTIMSQMFPSSQSSYHNYNHSFFKENVPDEEEEEEEDEEDEGSAAMAELFD